MRIVLLAVLAVCVVGCEKQFYVTKSTENDKPIYRCYEDRTPRRICEIPQECNDYCDKARDKYEASKK